MNINRKHPILYLSIFFISAIILWLVNSWISHDENCTNNSPAANQINSPVQKDDNFRDVPNIPSGEFKYGGSTTWVPIWDKIHPEIQNAQPNFTIKYQKHDKNETPGSGTGIRMLLGNKLHFSMSSRPLKDEEKKKGLIQKEIAIDGIAIAVNRELKIQSLTLDQLKDIYTGKTTNWKEFGGEDIPIIAYTRDPNDGGTPRYFINNVLKIKDEELIPYSKFAINTTDGIKKVANNKGGIYFASIPEVIWQCRVKSLPLRIKSEERAISPYISLQFDKYENCVRFKNRIRVNSKAISSGRYPITRKLYVIIDTNNPEKQKVGEAYANLMLTQQGQDLLKETGYASIYDRPNSTVAPDKGCQPQNRK
ncbi:MAG: substrate-binding domain-containing protein [Nostocaceae cyanobacterium]|nr:substrate-binding domain-containing protein [Nostocaceae cyanobacterium]